MRPRIQSGINAESALGPQAKGYSDNGWKLSADFCRAKAPDGVRIRACKFVIFTTSSIRSIPYQGRAPGKPGSKRLE